MEEFRRENTGRVSVNRKVVSEYTIKSKWFRHTPGNSWRVPELFWELLGFFRRKKPEMFRSCRNRFGCFSLMKITNPELFRNASKIILVGTGNVLRPTEIFSDLTVAEKCFMNSE